MEFRIEHDTMGEVKVPADHFWGAQTERSLENFRIGTETIPGEVIHAFAVLKSAAAAANLKLGKLSKDRADAIMGACKDIINNKYPEEFPLKVWQTGSGTQSNMNMNEVIAHVAVHDHPEVSIHPNDHVNMSQSSNDTFPTAMNMAAVIAIQENLIPAVDTLIETMKRLEKENADIIKIGRTHLQDAVPLRFSQEISGWRGMLEESKAQIIEASAHLRKLAIGGTAVGTGLNCPEGFDRICCEEISTITGQEFKASENKFHALTSKDGYVYVSGALKGLAANLMKIANDVRWLANGPRCGLGEISIPENEPGSSIMPGKVNPTQCEAMTMVAIQVMGNDTTIGIGASQGNFELNVFMPVLAYNMMQSIRLLSDAVVSFDKNCASGIKAKKDKMEENLRNSLMLVTCLSPVIGYENAAKCAHKAFEENTTLREAVLSLGFLSGEQYDETVRPEKMV
ncbi:class II fumarate hydratase [Oribacterium sp. P6A1]|uniref:class II fumarate hydratase n=1 Tax=Oribacterium sp. P6A1 TaxID=1410612 RepID=UPI00055D485F|nr:class II fumarate hydratase [Oribacterium sp. P6A1]